MKYTKEELTKMGFNNGSISTERCECGQLLIGQTDNKLVCPNCGKAYREVVKI